MLTDTDRIDKSHFTSVLVPELHSCRARTCQGAYVHLPTRFISKDIRLITMKMKSVGSSLKPVEGFQCWSPTVTTLFESETLYEIAEFTFSRVRNLILVAYTKRSRANLILVHIGTVHHLL